MPCLRSPRCGPERAIRTAIRQRTPVSAVYCNFVRYFCPHLLRRDRNGKFVVLAYQFAGGHDGGLPEGGMWCCFDLDGLRYVRPTQDRWIPGLLIGSPIEMFQAVLAGEEFEKSGGKTVAASEREAPAA